MEIIMDGEKYISLDEVEKKVGFKVTKIGIKINRGEFPAPRKIEVTNFWKVSDIEKYIEDEAKRIKYISLVDVERKVGLKRDRISQLMREGKFPLPFKLDPKAFWRISDIDEYIKNYGGEEVNKK